MLGLGKGYLCGVGGVRMFLVGGGWCEYEDIRLSDNYICCSAGSKK